MIPEPVPRGLVVWTRGGNQLPETRRVIHAPEVHQLVNHDVVANRWRHLHEPPVQADVAAARAGAPTPPLIANADAGHVQTMPGSQFQLKADLVLLTKIDLLPMLPELVLLSRGINLPAIGEPSPVQASHPTAAE